MKRAGQDPKMLHAIVNRFINKLPDPQQCPDSTIIQAVLVDNEEIILTAQKKKGANGFWWSVNNGGLLASIGQGINSNYEDSGFSQNR